MQKANLVVLLNQLFQAAALCLNNVSSHGSNSAETNQPVFVNATSEAFSWDDEDEDEDEDEDDEDEDDDMISWPDDEDEDEDYDDEDEDDF